MLLNRTGILGYYRRTMIPLGVQTMFHDFAMFHAMLHKSLTCNSIHKAEGGVSTDTLVGVCVCVCEKCNSPSRTPNANH